MLYDTPGAAIAKITPFGHRVTLPEDPNAPDPRVHRVAANPAEYEYGRLLRIDRIRLPDAEAAEALTGAKGGSLAGGYPPGGQA